MTEQVSPEQAQEAARQMIAAQAGAVKGDPAAAGIYGDLAGASAPPVPLDVAAAQPAEADVAALLERIAALEEAQRAAEPPPPEPPDYSLRVDPGAPGWLHQFAAQAEARLRAVEEKLGL